jgi:hypothetical protein
LAPLTNGSRRLKNIQIPNTDVVIPYVLSNRTDLFVSGDPPVKALKTAFFPPGPAALDGRLRVGDQLIEINGESTRNLTHADAIQLIKNGGRTVRLLVRRGKPPPHNLLGRA